LKIQSIHKFEELRQDSLDRIIFTMPSNKPIPRVSSPEPSVRPDGDTTAVIERQAQELRPPPMYQVVMLNDDYTPMEFVVMVLQEYFSRDLEAATEIMLRIHHEGRGVCGVYTKDVAATKVEMVLAAARRGGHPLQCVMEST
jgi:ATP-dependent Clp protease adaptor protein ClpS